MPQRTVVLLHQSAGTQQMALAEAVLLIKPMTKLAAPPGFIKRGTPKATALPLTNAEGPIPG